jgi:catechol 2,3-dioxygenase-like lactoylglutathione lyase family enzyme
MQGHHLSIRTADIHRAIAFYQQLGFEIEQQFTTGYTLACWLRGPAGRLELLQIPQPLPAADAFGDPHYVGYYHLSIDLTQEGLAGQSLSEWLQALGDRLSAHDLPLKILLPPTLQVIGDRCYQVAFIADNDGLPLEFLQDLGPVGSIASGPSE